MRSVDRQPVEEDAVAVRDSAASARRINGINYDAHKDTPIFEPLPARPESVVALDYSPDGRRMAIATGNGEIAVQDAATGGELVPWWRHGLSKLERLRFTPDGTGLVARGQFSVQRLDSESGKEQATHHWDPQEALALFVDPSGRNAATLDHERRVQLWQDGQKTHQLAEGCSFVGDYSWVFFDPKGRWVCLAGSLGSQPDPGVAQAPAQVGRRELQQLHGWSISSSLRSSASV